ncbi:MAG: tRNA (guanine(46)-N(7))-methyltransferase TrmB [Anaerovoracaceae bacterium]|jgi:tRNA (guanine-N7-)-methyltransferase
MRQRRIKGLEEKLDIYNGGIQVNPRSLKGKWNNLFDRPAPVYMELGCGKGQFITQMSEAYPDRNFIAVEGNRSAMLRALQKAVRHFRGIDPSEKSGPQGSAYTPPLEAEIPRGVFKVDPADAGVTAGEQFDTPYKTSRDDCLFKASGNLVFACMYLRNVTDCFEDGELSGIYLNFSDPWPKDRQAARRLTHHRYLEGYRQVLKPGSLLEFKTDNEQLFRFSMDEFDDFGLEKTEYTENLHSPDCHYRSKDFMTEYEKKFSLLGNKIYYCQVRF